MAVFTHITTEQAAAWTQKHFDLPSGNASATQTRLEEISEGIENTNYLLSFIGDANSSATSARYVLTLFEVWDSKMVDYYAALMRHLSAQAPVPAPLCPASDAGKILADKPCLLTPFIEGKSYPQPTAEACYKMGVVAAQLHKAAADFMLEMPNPRGNNWRQEAARQIIAAQKSPPDSMPPLAQDALALLQESLADDARLAQLPLPASPCHCDLFRNNILWHNDEIAGVIDFYFGGDDALIFDLAVCACDWCFDAEDDNNPAADFNTERLDALLQGYESLRPLCDLERQYFPRALQSAALRFWISRMHDLHFPRRASVLTPHNPQRFETILRRARHINMPSIIAPITQHEEQTHG